jgi:large subunit ribosomal protein L24
MEQPISKARLRKNDNVMVVKGRERGKTGKVLRVLPAENRVIVERLNLVKRHTKPRGAGSSGGILEKEAPIQLANVMIMCDRCNAPVRIGVRISGDDKARICRRCGEALGND